MVSYKENLVRTYKIRPRLSKKNAVSWKNDLATQNINFPKRHILLVNSKYLIAVGEGWKNKKILVYHPQNLKVFLNFWVCFNLLRFRPLPFLYFPPQYTLFDYIA